MRDPEAGIAELLAQRSALRHHVPLQEAGPSEVTRLQQKTIIDRVKMTAYNAEEWLLEPLPARWIHAVRTAPRLRSRRQAPTITAGLSQNIGMK